MWSREAAVWSGMEPWTSLVTGQTLHRQVTAVSRYELAQDGEQRQDLVLFQHPVFFQVSHRFKQRQ